MRKLVLVVGLVVVVYACSDAVGGVLEDAGTMLQDAGEQMQDAGAQAQESKTITCNQSYTRTPPGGEPSTTKYELVDTAGKGFPDVFIRQVFGSQQSPYLNCPEGWTCSGMPSGKMVAEYHLSTFIDGKGFVQTCPDPSRPNAPESVTLFY